ncbi:energy-coupling factor ABC transporter permease [Methanotrichaceae archaeon M04Ac]|uniref:Putative cobalt transport protein CbiM n=2 Tax=Candidatus Methanocrinis alkalitolerans TaxID=3033395 RepID=A0ABT5XG21_9EURY|nr:energy-coupling factor ABC transporter permease [Candidatus Methanocrinis alkalitolerans]MDF0593673.1 energy-coupling factor ABC transporter permease [Candidatus Methanocrinis alkalitolerans]
MEGFLPHPWWEVWYALSLPVVIYGIYKINQLAKERRETLPLLALAGAFIFVLSSLKLPSVTGSCSHPTGAGMGAIIFGPAITAVLCLIVLVYQALFLAHGGISTLGANVFSMGIVGPVVAYLVYRGCMRSKLNFYVSIFFAAFLADLATYLVTSLQLALAFPSATGGVLGSLGAFGTVFALTQVPLAIVEGVITALIFKYIIQVKGDVMVRLKVIDDKRLGKLKEMISA